MLPYNFTNNRNIFKKKVVFSIILIGPIACLIFCFLAYNAVFFATICAKLLTSVFENPTLPSRTPKSAPTTEIYTISKEKV